MHHTLWEKLKRIHLRDILHLFLFLLAWPISVIYKTKRPHLWLLCEYGNEARDNAYCLFRYIRREHPEQDAVYAVFRSSPDFDKVAALGETVEHGSLKHWIYYLAAEKNISTQKGGKPNAAVCYLLEVKLRILKNKRIFLQHGITKDDMKYLYYQDTFIDLFVCAAKPEYEYIKQRFGYPPGGVENLGFCRYDELYEAKIDPKQILVMPTWRDYIVNDVARRDTNAFQKTKYYREWNALLCDRSFQQLLESADLSLLFCPHRNMKPFLHLFEATNSRIRLLDWDKQDIQKLLKESALLVTDYSSVAMDFAYMQKPLLYYQFDLELFRSGHLPEGYFEYERDGFGPVFYDLNSLVAGFKHYADASFSNDCRYIERCKQFFSYYDRQNCQRNFLSIQKL